MKKKSEPFKVFTYTRSESKGLVVLIIIFLLVLAFRVWQSKNYHKLDIVFSWQEIIESESEHRLINEKEKPEASGKLPDEELTPNHFLFDPNTASVTSLIKNGFSEHVAQNIVKYRLNGGIFRQADDLFKIYSIDSSLVLDLQGFIVIEAKEENIEKTRSKTWNLEINEADSAAFCSLAGIGPVLSGRIIKYRNALGGFYSINQLTEVYGIEPEVFEKIRLNLSADSSGIQKIPLNEVSIEELMAHPYLKRSEARAIISFRRIRGTVSAKSELLENYILSENTFNKVQHYFKIN